MELIEAYYAVARDIEARARHMLEIADTLGKAADSFCEQRMREKSPPEQPSDTSTERS